MNKKYLLFIITVIYIPIFSSCSHVAFWKTASDAEIVQAEDNLARTIDSLLLFDPLKEPDQYIEARDRFEIALMEYLLLTGKRDRSIVHFDYHGTNILIPVRSVEHFGGQLDLIQAPAPRVLWQRVGPVFHDEMVDVALLNSNGENPTIAVLFADSLVVFSPLSQDTPITTFQIPDSFKNNIRSRTPAGLIETDEQRIYFTSAHADTSFVIDFNRGENVLEPNEHPVALKARAGRPYFQYHTGNEIQNVFGIRRVSQDSLLIVLDDRGIPSLVSQDDNSIVWKSDRAWGSRLFKTGSHTFAITHPTDNCFILFEILQDSVIVRGISPIFHGEVAGVAHTVLSGREGYLVGVTAGPRVSGKRYSQLYFVANERVQWRDAEKIAVPLFPDYDSQFTLIDNVSRVIDAGYIRKNMHPFVQHNVFETLIVRDHNNGFINNLAVSVIPDIRKRRWTIALRDDIRFSDGDTLDAQAVRDSWMRNIRDCNENACKRKWVTDNIDTIRVIDNLTIRIELNKSLPNFPEHLTAACFQVTKEIGDQQREIGTGAYMITSTDRNRVTFGRNPYYRHGEAALRQISVITRQTDNIDYVTSHQNAGAIVRQPRELGFFGAIDAFKNFRADNKSIYFLAMNPGSPRLRSVSARSRIVTSFDRQAVLTVVTEARSEIATSFFVDTDKQQHTEGGSLSNLTNSLRIIYNTDDTVAGQIAQRLAIRLQQEGITAQRPEGVSLERLRQLRRNRQYDILVDSILPFFSSSEYNMYDLLNNGYIFDDEISKKMNSLLSSDSEDTVREIETYLQEQYYLYPLIRTSIYTVVPDRLNDAEYRNGIMLDLSRAWFPR